MKQYVAVLNDGIAIAYIVKRAQMYTRRPGQGPQ